MSDQEPTEATPPAQGETEAAAEPAAEAEPAPEPEPEASPEPEPEPQPEPEPAAEAPPEAATVVTPPAAPRRLHRSREDRVIAGVCGGLGEYFGVDAVLIRIAALVLVFAGGAGILLYVIGWIAMPEAPEPGTPEAVAAAPRAERTSGAFALGLIFIVLGALFLVDEAWSDFLAWKYIWPVALIVIGAAVLVRARQ